MHSISLKKKRTTPAGRRPRRRGCRRRSRPGRRCCRPRASRGRSSCLLGVDCGGGGGGRRRCRRRLADGKNRLASRRIPLRASRLVGRHWSRAKKKKGRLLPAAAAAAEAGAEEAGAAAFLEIVLVAGRGRRFDDDGQNVRACPCPGSCFGPGACGRCGRGCGRGCAPVEENASASASDVLLLGLLPLVVVRRRSFLFPLLFSVL